MKQRFMFCQHYCYDDHARLQSDHHHYPLRWRHNDHAGVSNHQPHGCLLNRLFRRKSKKTSKLRLTGLCAGNSPGTGEFPAQMASYAENVSIWWRHHAYTFYYQFIFTHGSAFVALTSSIHAYRLRQWDHSFENGNTLTNCPTTVYKNDDSDAQMALGKSEPHEDNSSATKYIIRHYMHLVVVKHSAFKIRMIELMAMKLCIECFPFHRLIH